MLQSIINILPRFFRRQYLIYLISILFPSMNIQKIIFKDNTELIVSIFDGNARSWLIIGTCDDEYLNILEPFIGEEGEYFDIGANFGYHSFSVINRYRNINLDYHLFEPNPVIYDCLIESKKIYNNFKISINHCLVGNEEQSKDLVVFKNHYGASHVMDKAENINNHLLENKYKIKQIILDGYIQNKGIKNISFMKIDVEGYELFVLEGLLESIKNNYIKVIFIELSSNNLSRYGLTSVDLINFLQNNDFCLFWCRDKDMDMTYAKNKIKLKINEYELNLAIVGDVPNEVDTDILAISKVAINSYK